MSRHLGDIKYKKTYVNKVYKYLKLKKDKMRKRVKSDGEKSTSWEHYIVVDLPSIEDLANYLKLSRTTIYTWEKNKVDEDFNIALDKVRSEQKKKLVNNGLAGTYNPVIAKLILSSDHGMREKIDTTSDDKPINTFSDAQIDRIASRIASGKGRDGNTSS